MKRTYLSLFHDFPFEFKQPLEKWSSRISSLSKIHTDLKTVSFSPAAALDAYVV